ncbi:MAG: hypothetical protein IJ711_02800 [Lachnospiraceae bacterium]|nr:hypothetical protein [Lachnospiraceae bacterium]
MGTKKQSVFRRLTTALLCSMLAAALVFTVTPISAQAAAKKVTASTNYKKAPKLKVGTNKVTAKKNSAYVKFTAAKAGTYTFTMSDVATIPAKKPDHNLGHFTIRKDTGYYLSAQKVSTNGGKETYLEMATKDSYNDYYKGQKVKKNSYLASRYGKLKLKKGETVYIQYFHTGGKCSYTMKVKKG